MWWPLAPAWASWTGIRSRLHGWHSWTDTGHTTGSTMARLTPRGGSWQVGTEGTMATWSRRLWWGWGVEGSESRCFSMEIGIQLPCPALSPFLSSHLLGKHTQLPLRSREHPVTQTDPRAQYPRTYQGSVPQGSLDQGSVPQGSVPQDSVPQGSGYQGSVPQDLVLHSVHQGSVATDLQTRAGEGHLSVNKGPAHVPGTEKETLGAELGSRPPTGPGKVLLARSSSQCPCCTWLVALALHL